MNKDCTCTDIQTVLSKTALLFSSLRNSVEVIKHQHTIVCCVETIFARQLLIWSLDTLHMYIKYKESFITIDFLK